MISGHVHLLSILSWGILVYQTSMSFLLHFILQRGILINRFRSAFLSLNSDANQEDFDNVFKNIKVELAQDDLGKSFFERLQGKKEYKLIDWENLENNTFEFSLEVECVNDGEEFRPDITLFINGLPLSFIEVKKPNAIRDGKTGIQSEFERIEKRFKNKKFRKFINITQLITYSDNKEYDQTQGGAVSGLLLFINSLPKNEIQCF